jgi:hypothetical protein
MLSLAPGGAAARQARDVTSQEPHFSKKSMEGIMEDLRTHYEISYVPGSHLFDGRFRKTKVTDPTISAI